MKLFIAGNEQKFPHFRRLSFMYAIRHPNLPHRSRDIISAKIHKSHPHLAVAVTHPPPSVAKSQSRSIYYPPPPSNVFLAPAPSGTPDSSVKIACLAPLLRLGTLPGSDTVEVRYNFLLLAYLVRRGNPGPK